MSIDEGLKPCTRSVVLYLDHACEDYGTIILGKEFKSIRVSVERPVESRLRGIDGVLQRHGRS